MQTRAEILQDFLRGRNCAQCTLAHYAEAQDFEVEESDRYAACFGGGLESGGPCGAVIGALMGIGLSVEDPGERHRINLEFQRRFTERNGSLLCKELLGYDMSQPGQHEAAMASGRIAEVCPDLVLSAVEILDELLEEEEEA